MQVVKHSFQLCAIQIVYCLHTCITNKYGKILNLSKVFQLHKHLNKICYYTFHAEWSDLQCFVFNKFLIALVLVF